MNSNVVSLRAEPPDPLLVERDRLAAEIDRFGVVDRRQAEADRALATVDQALAQLDAEEKGTMVAWAEKLQGEAPEPRMAERRRLMGERLDRQAAADAARVAVEAVAAKRTGLIVELNRVGARIRERKIAAMLDEGRRVHGEALALADEIGGKLQRVMGLRQALVSMTTEAARRNDADLARVLNAVLGEIDGLKRLDLLADPATVDAHAVRWLEALR